ncbi:uncharacterized protein SCHCODRAFT_02678745 [Schizophyllum commune H4-8]|nr:uncharacterized protein SCHCODRAFT_02678745 [Schizophyllum commune H4-8]KAI5891114.1 hypothetical protein SCHCODRAFT_02678745 [Schizophyllum commune H4-8]
MRRAPIDSSQLDKICVHLQTRYNADAADVRQRINIDSIRQYGRVRVLNGGDDMRASELVPLASDRRDATWVKYDLLVDRNKHRRRAPEILVPKSFFGQLMNIYVVEVLASPQLHLTEPETVILARIHSCTPCNTNSLGQLYYKDMGSAWLDVSRAGGQTRISLSVNTFLAMAEAPLFTKIAKDIWLSHGSSPAQKIVKETSDPECDHPLAHTYTLLNVTIASLYYVAGYSHVYHEWYPNATILLIQSEPAFFFKPNSWNEQMLIPAAEVIESFANADATPPRILAHSFSNGGSSQLCTLGTLLRSRNRSPTSAAASALIVDSAPATGTLRTAIRAFAGLIPNPVIRFAVSAVVATFWSFNHYFLFPVFGVLPVGEKLKADLLRPDVLPWMSSESARLYVHSKTDELVGWEEVQEHVGKLKEAGIKVREVLLERAPHVALARANPELYWGAVKDIWADASGIGAA